MNNGSRIYFVVFVIVSFACRSLDAQQYDRFGDYNGGNGASVNRNSNNNQFGGQFSRERPPGNELDFGGSGNYPSNSGSSNGGFGNSRPTQGGNDFNSNGYGNQNSDFQTNGQMGPRRPGPQVQGPNMYSPGQQNNDYGSSGFGSNGFQGAGQSRPTQPSSNEEYDSRPPQSSNFNDNAYSSNSGQMNHRRPAQQSSGNSRPTQSMDRTNGYGDNNNYQSNAQTTTKRRESQQVSGVIASNDGFVQPLPDRNSNNFPYSSTTQTRPSSSNNNSQGNRQTSQGRPTYQDQSSDSNDEESSESRSSYSVDRNSINNNSSGKTTHRPSSSQSRTSRRPSSVSAVQGNRGTKKPVTAALTSNKKKQNNEGRNSQEQTSSGNKSKKRVSQIKYEQYLSSIFPDLGNEEVQEITDFHGRKLAKPGQFPHMGAIGFKNQVLNKTEYKCGASLISDIWVITSAHCTEYNGLKPTFVRFGDLNLKAGEEDSDPQTRRISRITNHPSYRDESLYNDIALLLLNKIVVFTEFVQPIRIWYRDEIPFTMAYAMGFGAVQFAGAATNRLTELELTIVSNDACARQMPKQTNAARGIIDSQICAIDNSRKESDTFQGDSGGPLEISFYAEEGGRQRQYLIGITSFGVVGSTRLPGVYTRVSSFVDWIEQTVWSSDYHAQ